MESYRSGKFPDAYQEFQQTLKAHPQTKAADKLQFDSGAAAYKMKDYGKALESFSQALLSPDAGLQSKSHYNLGNTLYERGEAQKGDDKKLADWTNALQHYEETLKLEPQNQEAKDNYEFVKKKIEELKNKKQEQPSPTPSPSPQNKDQKKDKEDKQDQQKDQQQQQQQQQSQSQDQSGKGQNQKPEDKQDQSQAKNDQQKKEQPKSGESPSPSPSAGQEQKEQPSPSPAEGKDNPQDRQGQKEQEKENEQGKGEEGASPSPGEGESPSRTPTASPQKKMAGEIKGTDEKKPEEQAEKNAQMAEAEEQKDGQMSERQAEALLQSMKDEEARVQLDERRAARRVYNDW